MNNEKPKIKSTITQKKIEIFKNKPNEIDTISILWKLQNADERNQRRPK